jgi:hypothetical protein
MATFFLPACLSRLGSILFIEVLLGLWYGFDVLGWCLIGRPKHQTVSFLSALGFLFDTASDMVFLKNFGKV